MVDYNDVKKHLVDELNDVLNYLDMSEKANDEFERMFFKDAAKDERSHAKYLKHILDRNGNVSLSDSEKDLWKKVEDRCQSV